MTPFRRRTAGSPKPAAQTRSQRARLTAIPYLLLIALLAVGTVPIYSPFAGPRGVIAAAEGIAVGALVALAAARLRLGPLLTLALAAIAHVGLAPLLLRDVASGMTAVRAVLAGTVTVWKDSLTLPLPLSGYAGMSILPWLVGLAITTLSARLLIGVGVGLLVGLIINTMLTHGGYSMNKWSEEQLFEVAYGAPVLIFGGLGLLCSYVLERRFADKEKNERP